MGLVGAKEKGGIGRGAHLFVSLAFSLLALAFLASTASVIYEFRDLDWPSMIIAHSHLFIFFPILGLLTLAAFYVPSVVFTDLYWRHKPYGQARFLLGFLGAGLFALYLAFGLGGQPLRGIWEISPEVLRRDREQGPVAGPDCRGASPAQSRQACPRRPLLTALQDLREAAQKRTTIAPFSRVCVVDAMLEQSEAARFPRYCFPSGTMLDADDCCRLQREMTVHLYKTWSDPAQRSKAAELDRYLIPFKVFFVIVLIVIGCFLMLWRRELRDHYGAHVPAIERGIVVGALAMLFWPLMDYAYQQTSDVLFGRHYAGVNVRLSLVIAPWAVLLLLYFMDLGKNSERVAQISTILGAAFAVLRYQEINDIAPRLVGAGAAWWHFLLLGLFAIVGFAVLRVDLAKWIGGAPVGEPTQADRRPLT